MAVTMSQPQKYILFIQEGHQETELAATSECQVENVNSIHQHPACLPPEALADPRILQKNRGAAAGHVALAISNNIIPLLPPKLDNKSACLQLMP